MNYTLTFTRKAHKALMGIDRKMARRIVAKLKWLAEHGDEVVHHYLTSVPENLKGLCRVRVGGWRALYWLYYAEQRIVVYGIAPRSEAYRNLP